MGKTLDIKEQLSCLTRQTLALSDKIQRAHKFKTEISSLSTNDVFELVKMVILQGWTSKETAERILLEVVMFAVASDVWTAEQRHQLLEKALEANNRLICLLFGGDLLYEENHLEQNLPVPAYQNERVLSLGERKSLARKLDRKGIGLALRDTHPSVIENILNNPKITENDVVFIAARRPTSATVLASVGVHPKWRVSRNIATTLVLNPQTPTRTALSLLHIISLEDAKRIVSEERASSVIIEALTELLSLRQQEE